MCCNGIEKDCVMATREDLESYEKFEKLFAINDKKTVYFSVKYEGKLLPVIAEIIEGVNAFVCKAEVSNDDKRMIVAILQDERKDGPTNVIMSTVPGSDWLPPNSGWRGIGEDVHQYLWQNGHLD